MKRDYCKEHGIQLIVIPYQDKEYDRIREILIENGIIACNA